MAAYPRRSERVSLKRSVQLVFHSPQGQVTTVPAATFAVNCHGAGVYTRAYHPLGSEVFLVDGSTGVGAWGRLVWEGSQMRDGRYPVGIEFARPSNHWKTRLVPPSWMPYVDDAQTERTYQLPNSDKVVLVGRNGVEPEAAVATESEPCRCCGSKDQTSQGPAGEALCRVCRGWAY